MTMESRTLGRDLQVSAVSLGCMGLSHAFGAPTEKTEAVKLLQTAFDLGYTMFDTAECYTGKYANGSISYNEELVGEAIKPFRDKVAVATKFGVHHADSRSLLLDSSPLSIRRAVEGSLKRLGVETIDLYYQHRIDPQVSPEEVAEVMIVLMGEGKITHWGISEANEDYLRRAHAVCPVTAIQNRYSMMARWHESLFPVLEELRVGYVAFSPLANGFLSGRYGVDSRFEADDYRGVMPQFTPEAVKQNQALLKLLTKLAQEKNATPAKISLAWILGKKPYIVPIPGSRKPERLEENAGAAEVKLSQDEVAAIDKALESMEISSVFGGSKIAAR